MQPVDLTNLREMTGGDAEMEEALFEEFFSSFEEGIGILSANRGGDTEIWRKQAHALKGIALNLGANRLGGLCKQAQEECTAPADTKGALLDSIRSEYSQVHAYLKQAVA